MVPSLAACGIDYYLAPSSVAETQSSSDFLATSDVAAQCYGSTADYPLLNEDIKACERFLQGYARQSIVKRHHKLVLDGYPTGDTPILLPIPPVAAGSSLTVQRYNENNASTNMASTDVVLHAVDGDLAFLTPQPGKNWPSNYERQDAVTIWFQAGYASTDIPETLKKAGKMVCAHWYKNREAVVTGAISKEIEVALDALLASEGWAFVS